MSKIVAENTSFPFPDLPEPQTPVVDVAYDGKVPVGETRYYTEDFPRL